MKTPLHKQQLQRDPIEILSSALRHTGTLTGADVLAAIESATGGSLSEDLRTNITVLIDPTVRRRGRPALNPTASARLEFAFEQLDEEYTALLATVANDESGDGGQPPSERAYRRLATDMREYFGHIDWRSLQNKHSAWRNGRLRAPAPLITDSVDFEDEIDRQFLAHNNRSEFK